MTLRLLHFTVQPVLVEDDGENLRPGPPIKPTTLSLADLARLVETWPEQLAALQPEAEPDAP